MGDLGNLLFKLKENSPVTIGGWYQTGKLSIPNVTEEQGAQGLYLFRSQRVLFCNPGIDDSSFSLFWQLRYNHTRTLPMNRFVGFSFTAFALTRPSDSFGIDFADS